MITMVTTQATSRFGRETATGARLLTGAVTIASAFFLAFFLAAPTAQAEKAQDQATSASEEAASGVALMEATGLDVVLKLVEQGVQAQVRDSGGDHSQTAIEFAADAFDGDALTQAVAKDIDALPAETREAVSAFYASETGSKLAAMEREINLALGEESSELAKLVLTEGGKLKDDETFGPLVKSVRRDGGSLAFNDSTLRVTTYALLVGVGDLRDVQDQTVIDEKIDGELKGIWELIHDFDDSAYAYGFREASAEELDAYGAFYRTEAGAAFVEVARASVRRRLDAASKDFELRLRNPGKKTKS